MRKIIAILLVLVLLFSLGSCGKKSNEKNEAPEESLETSVPAEETVAAEEAPVEETSDESLDPEAVAQALAGAYTAKIYGVFDMEMSLYPDQTGYFVPLYSEDGELIKPCEYKLGDDRNLYLTIDGETYVGSFDLTGEVIILQYGDEQLVYNRTSDDYEALYDSYAELLAEDELGDDNTAPILYAFTLENINIRSGAGTSYEKIDKIAAGTVTEIFQKTDKGDGYVWYRIGDGRWIADDGTWLSICSADEYTEGYFDVPEEEDVTGEPAESSAEDATTEEQAPADGTTGETLPETPPDGSTGTMTPYVPKVYEGRELDIINTVKSGISWLTQFESIFPASHREASFYWDWELIATSENTWNVGLMNVDGINPHYEYYCTVTFDGTNYVVSDITDTWAQSH